MGECICEGLSPLDGQLGKDSKSHQFPIFYGVQQLGGILNAMLLYEVENIGKEAEYSFVVVYQPAVSIGPYP